MKVADWLTYTDIDQLKQLNRFYKCEFEGNSKHELICSLLREMGKTSNIKEIVENLRQSEYRFFQLIVLDTTPLFTMEELVAKGRAALLDSEGEPRSLVASAVKKGWLFKGYSSSTQNLFQIPTDTKERLLNLFIRPFQDEQQRKVSPEFYRDEESLIVSDLYYFLQSLQRDIFRLSVDGSIYKNQQKILFQGFFIREETLAGKGPRFGFGRNYHVYPDRFSLIYDYAFYKGYISEDSNGILSLTEAGIEKLIKKDPAEGKNIYRFWIRLYKKPISHLPIIIRWIGLLAYPNWVSLDIPYKAVKEWMKPYYYESIESLFQKITKMMLHLGVLKIGTKNDQNYVLLTESGKEWLYGVSAFKEKAIEEGFMKSTQEFLGK